MDKGKRVEILNRSIITNYELAWILTTGELPPNNPTQILSDRKYFNAITGAIKAKWLKEARFESYHDDADSEYEYIWSCYGLKFDESCFQEWEQDRISVNLLEWGDIRDFLDQHPEYGRPSAFYPEIQLRLENMTIVDAAQREKDLLLTIEDRDNQIVELQKEKKLLLAELEKYRPLAFCLRDDLPGRFDKLKNTLRICFDVYGPLKTEEEWKNVGLANELDRWERKHWKLKEKDAIGRILTPSWPKQKDTDK